MFLFPCAPSSLPPRPVLSRSAWLGARLVLPLMLAAPLGSCGDEPTEAPPLLEFREGVTVQTIDAIADTTVTASGPFQNTNYGDRTAGFLTATDSDRLLIRFDPVEGSSTECSTTRAGR